MFVNWIHSRNPHPDDQETEHYKPPSLKFHYTPQGKLSPDFEQHRFVALVFE